MPTRKTKLLAGVGENFRSQLPNARKARGFTSQAQLAERLTELGYPMHETTIARIESGERKVSLEDAVMIAIVTGCQLAHLIAPTDANTKVTITSKLTFTASKLRDWVRGKDPLFLDDARYFFAGPLASEDEVQSFFSGGWAGAFGRTWSDVLNPVADDSVEVVDLAEEEAP